MSAAFINPYGTEWGIGYLWHKLDWLVRIDVAALGLLLVYAVVVVIRAFRCYQTAGHGDEINACTKKLAAANLNIQVGNLKSIASIAPYLGLMGTCIGLLSAFSGVGMQRDAARAWIATKIAAALVPAAAGIIVAVPATCAYEYAHTRLELLFNELPRRKQLLTSRFTLPPFALIAAYGLAILVQTYMTLPPVHTPKGFDVQVASSRCNSDLSDRLIVLHIAHDGKVLLNFEEVDWEALQGRLSDIYGQRENRVLYVLADEDVRFQKVADAIDLIHNAQEPATSRPLNITAQLLTPNRCPEPVLIETIKKRERQFVAKCTPRLVKQRRSSFDDNKPIMRKGEKSSGYSPLVTFEIQESGNVMTAVLKRSSGYSGIDRAALDWVKGAKYNARPGCGVIETSMTVDIHFGPAASNEP